MFRARLALVALGLVAAPIPRANAGSSIATQPTAAAMDLAMDGAGLITTHIVKIAVVELSSDRPLGFTLSISAGRLMKGGGRAIPFQVTAVDHAAAPPTASAFTAPSGSLYTLAMGPGTYGKDLYIKYSAAALQDPGTYSASLELDVVDN